MRRCPSCQAPNPDEALYCMACGMAMPGALRAPWFTWADLGSWRELGRTALALLPLLAFQLTFKEWLTAGPVRVESQFLAFHLGEGLLLGAGLAWAREERLLGRWLGWILAGLVGGMLAEGLELWFMYRQVFSGLALWVWAEMGLKDRPSLVYELLQGLRLLGLALPLWANDLSVERRPARWLQSPLWLALGLACGSQLRGAFLAWGALADFNPLAWQALAVWLGSRLALAWALGPRGLRNA
ncbi:MAG TPA: zinc ribbon domain-containing protein [bacterium]|jgi:hypothetical protein|nr:zinc ribbon domain-containing protein [bacterium]